MWGHMAKIGPKFRKHNPFKPSLRFTPDQKSFLEMIRHHGGTVLSDHETGFWYHGKQESAVKIRALIKKGALVGMGDGLFQDAPSQTYSFSPSCLR